MSLVAYGGVGGWGRLCDQTEMMSDHGFHENTEDSMTFNCNRNNNTIRLNRKNEIIPSLATAQPHLPSSFWHPPGGKSLKSVQPTLWPKKDNTSFYYIFS